METRTLGSFGPVSALTLGGGGLGQLWGETTREEAVATAKAAVDHGITLLDMAPGYGRGEAEMVIGEAFGGKLPEGVRVTTKCQAGTLDPDAMAMRLEKALLRSLAAMKLERVDLFFLHSQIIPDEYVMGSHAETQDKWCTTWTSYTEAVIPAMGALKARGLIGDWGITGSGLPITIMEALRHEIKPSVVQAIANLMDSPGGIRQYEEPPEPRNIIRTATNNNVAVMGIRAVQAGALTRQIDRLMEADDPEMLDYRKAEPFRALCETWGEDPALVAHQYSLSMDGISTVVLGVKNRQEMADIVKAHEAGPLDAERKAEIDKLRLNFFRPKVPID